MKYMAIMPGKRKPLAVAKGAADFYRQKAKKFFEVPDHLSAEKAREAIKHGMTDEAGIRLTWADGRPVAGTAGPAAELQGMAFVPAADLAQLRNLHDGQAGVGPWSQGFWNKVRELRRPSPSSGLVVGWEPLLQAVNTITGSQYTLEQLQAIVKGQTIDGLPVHERRQVGPVDLTAMHRTPFITFGSTAPHAWAGEPHFREVGFASDPRVIVCVYARPGEYSSVIPQARQKALGLADVNGWSLGFVPSVGGSSRTTMFTDQEGKRRRGQKYEISFPVIGGLQFPRPASRFC